MERIKKFPIGGVHLPEEKDLTNLVPIEQMPPPVQVAIPLKQHIGAVVNPLVTPGQRVTRGECIGVNGDALSARVHSSVTGTVVGIEERTLPDGSRVPSVIITTDGDQSREALLDHVQQVAGSRSSHQADFAPELVRAAVEQAGIVGLGGAAFPTHVKLSPPEGTVIDAVILNGAECEPYITIDDRLMQEETPRIFRGLEMIRTTTGAELGYVACEVNKPEALKKLKAEAANWEHLEAVALDTRYPHGAEKHLIKAALNREVPLKSLPTAVGVIVNNVQTAFCIAEAVEYGRTLHSRVITVSGPVVNRPGNLRVPLGTSVADVIEFCGGATEPDARVILGGPMTGVRIHDYSVPVTKSTSGIVLLSSTGMSDEFEREPLPCIRCGKCVEVCPMYLAPNRITSYVNSDMIEDAIYTGVNDCILCGACEFICPSKRPLLRWLREGKAKADRFSRIHRVPGGKGRSR